MTTKHDVDLVGRMLILLTGWIVVFGTVWQ